MEIIRRTAAELRALELRRDDAVRLGQLALNLEEWDAATRHALEAAYLQDLIVRSEVLRG